MRVCLQTGLHKASYCFLENLQLIPHEINEYLMFVDLALLDDLYSTVNASSELFSLHHFSKRPTSQLIIEGVSPLNVSDCLELLDLSLARILPLENSGVCNIISMYTTAQNISHLYIFVIRNYIVSL